jgi:hypothetical protein
MPTYPVGISNCLQKSANAVLTHQNLPRLWSLDAGVAMLMGRHLRLASATHARPREAGQYLRFDAARPIDAASDLLACLESVF